MQKFQKREKIKSPYPEYYTAKHLNKGFILVNSEKRAKEFEINLKSFLKHFNKNSEVIHIPISTEIHDTLSQFKRNYAIYKLKRTNNIFFISVDKVLDIPVSKNREIITLKKGCSVNVDKLFNTLIEFGYIKVEKVENEGEFSFKGARLSINIPFVGLYYIDFFGDEIENIYKVSKLLTKKPVETVDIFQLYDFPVYINDNFDIAFKKEEALTIRDLIANIPIVFEEKIKEKGNILNQPLKGFEVVKLPITKPLYLLDEKTSFVPEIKSKIEPELNPIEIGDYIIHEDFGIGIFRGIETKNINGKDYDFMVLEYADGEKINVSYLHFDKIFKYETSSKIKLDKIGAPSWRNLKKKVRKSLEKVARELIELYTEREKITRPPYQIEDELIQKFEDSFEFVETPDQLKAIWEVKNDLKSEKPMDRVICGDVGFGKTEVALRGAFISAINGKQTLVLTPTTVLSYQHYKKFKERLEPFGIIVENLSRLKSTKETKDILQKLAEGKIDIVVGTHKALSDKVKFKNLGLLIIDEEHRFGVRAKEKIKQIKKDVDTLYMTATPIPRTLNMSLSGFKKLSIINTPPEGRLETKTYMVKKDPQIIKKAVEKEISRGGQVFYIHNRIQTIEKEVDFLKKMFPELRISYIHGRMRSSQIEKEITRFEEKKIDILVSTSIVETGIDIPNANTLIIDRADLFGLAQLYHLRGRVGRGSVQAYCYLLLPEDEIISDDAKKRISTIMKLTRPGSGIKVAIEDMKIRGVGNIFGVEQSGNIKAIGYEFYIKLLKDTLLKTQNKNFYETIIEVDFDAFIPSNFITDETERMNIYLTLSKSVDDKEIQELEDYLTDFYKEIPVAFKRYILIEKIKKIATSLSIKKIKIKRGILSIYWGNLEENKLMFLINEFKPERIFSDYFETKVNAEDLELIYKKLKKIATQ